MTRRLLLGLLVFLASAAPAAAIPVQQVVARSHAYFERVLGVELADRPVTVGPGDVMRSCAGLPAADCAGLAYHDRIYLSEDTWNAIKTWRPNRPGFPPAGELQVLAHEQLHDLASPVFLEHGAIDAFLADRWADWSLKVTGHRILYPGTSYPETVAYVRRSSALATGRPWRSSPATWWRLNFLRAGNRRPQLDREART